MGEKSAGRSIIRYKTQDSIFEYQRGRSTYIIGVKLYWEKIGKINSCPKGLDRNFIIFFSKPLAHKISCLFRCKSYKSALSLKVLSH
jgi:hypothetical protein